MKLRLAAIFGLALIATPLAHAQNPLLDFVNDLYKPIASVTLKTKAASGVMEGVTYTVTLKDIAPPAEGYDPRLEKTGIISVASDPAKAPVPGRYQVTFKLTHTTQAGKLALTFNGFKTTCSVGMVGVGQSTTCSDSIMIKDGGITASLRIADGNEGFAAYAPEITIARMPD